jgi:hypothetical protein
MVVKLKGKVKEFRTSKYYGVRVDIRTVKDTIQVYYRTEICVENIKYYLGAYTNEKQAAYAFNVGFSIMSNGHYIIENLITLTDGEKEKINKKVANLINNKNIKLLKNGGNVSY